MDNNELGGRLAANLRKIRIYRGLLQAEVADVLELVRSSYSCYEIGKSIPSAITLKRIADFYGVTVDSFFSDSIVPPMPGDTGPARRPKPPRQS